MRADGGMALMLGDIGDMETPEEVIEPLSSRLGSASSPSAAFSSHSSKQ